MPITAPTPITAAPTVPDSTTPETTFDAQYEAFNTWEKEELQPGANALAENVFDNATEAQTLADAAAQSATDADQAKTDAIQAKDDAEEAVLSIDTLNQQYLGAQASNPTTGKDGVPLVAGNFYINTGTGFLLAHDGSAWVQAVASSGGVSTINGLPGAVELPKVLTYANRANLRANETWVHALVDGLGWFQWYSGSDEPDDDESCFATASGRWLLQAPHWDVVALWALPNDSTRDRQIEDQTAAWPGRMLRGTAVCGITSVASAASPTFSVPVIGAKAGDRVFATTPAALGATDADSARLSFHAYCETPGVATVRLCNASAATANLSTAAQGTWSVTVIQEV